jgi:hypothetical protein
MLQEEANSLSLLDEEILSNDDVLMVPKLGILSSRSEAKIEPYIYSSPMDTVTGYDLTKAMVENNQYAVVCRFIKEEWNKCLREFYDNPSVFFAIGSKTEDVENLIEQLKTIMPSDTDNIPPLSVAVDIAHGDTLHAHAVYRWLSQQPSYQGRSRPRVCLYDQDNDRLWNATA